MGDGVEDRISIHDRRWCSDIILQSSGASHLVGDGDALLSGHVLAQLLAVVTSGAVLQVDNPALNILDGPTLLLESSGNCFFTTEMFVLMKVRFAKELFYLVSKDATHCVSIFVSKAFL